MASGKVKTKNRYQSMLWMYKKRRDTIRKNLYVWRGDNKLYNMRVKKINLRIWYIRMRIKQIAKKERQVEDVIDRVKEFNDVDIRKLTGSGRKTEIEYLTRSSFFKYIMELGYEGSFVAAMTGYFRTTPCMTRMEFQKTFKTNPENREFYHRFVEYMNRTN